MLKMRENSNLMGWKHKIGGYGRNNAFGMLKLHQNVIVIGMIDMITRQFRPLNSDFVTVDTKKCLKWGQNSNFRERKYKIRLIWKKWCVWDAKTSSEYSINGYCMIAKQFSTLKFNFVTRDTKNYRKCLNLCFHCLKF